MSAIPVPVRLMAASLAALAVAGCGGSSPMAPSTVTAGAVVEGSLQTTGGSSAPQAFRGLAAVPASELVVSVPGTGLQTSFAGGQFRLEGVPSGPITLQFSGPSFTDTLDLPDVQSSETITLILSLTDTDVVLESERRSLGMAIQLEARVESLPPTTAADTFVAGGVTVVTSATTQFFLDGAPATFADLGLGVRVHVSGQPAGDDIVANVVTIQNTNGALPVVINGIVEDFSGSATDFEFTIDGRLIQGDDTTEFFGGSVFADLADGVRVEIKGQQQDGYVFALRIHVNGDDADDDQQDSASIEGPLTSIGGASPLLTLVVDGTTVTTTAATVVRRRGDVQDLDVLELQMTLHVVGDRQPDSSIVARLIQIKDDEDGAAFEIEGSLGGLKGSCPSVQFKVNGYDIVTDATTSVLPSPPGCAGLKSGDHVTVEGVVQPNGTVLATEVRR